MCYAFDFLRKDPPSGTRVGRVLRRFMDAAADGWACWAFSNHDAERHATRWSLDAVQLEVYLALLLSLRGSVCLYQGEELGLTEAYVPYEDLQDPYGKRFWPKFRGRDGCRTPMVWLGDQMQGGFTEVKPWLPVAMEHLRMAVNVQEADPGSMLAFYRRLLAFRKGRPALAKGSFVIHETAAAVVSYLRELGEESVFCAFNLGPEPVRTSLPAGDWRVIDGTGFAARIDGAQALLPPHQALFAERGLKPTRVRAAGVYRACGRASRKLTQPS